MFVKCLLEFRRPFEGFAGFIAGCVTGFVAVVVAKFAGKRRTFVRRRKSGIPPFVSNNINRRSSIVAVAPAPTAVFGRTTVPARRARAVADSATVARGIATAVVARKREKEPFQKTTTAAVPAFSARAAGAARSSAVSVVSAVTAALIARVATITSIPAHKIQTSS